MRERLCALCTLIVIFCVTADASAHSGAKRYVDATPTAEGAALVIRADAAQAAAANGLGAELSTNDLASRAAIIGAWTTRGIELRVGDIACPATAHAPRLVGDAVVVKMDARCGDGERKLVDASLIEDGHQTIVTRVDATGQQSTLILNNASDAMPLAAPPTTVETMGHFVVQGAIHLVTGYDHMLFVLSLLFAAGLVSRKHGSRKALRDVAWIITAFTLGHSVTLIVASLGWVSLPMQWVEATIAASIIVVAAMNIIKPEAESLRANVAFGFGLIHGFGFSSVLAEVGLPTGQHAAALLSFNVGIELAQLAFVAVAMVPLAWLAKQRFYERAVMQAGSAAIALCAAVWVVERVLV